MLQWIKQFLLLQKLDSLSLQITRKLFEVEGDIELDKLLIELGASGGSIETQFIISLIISIADSIRNSGPSISKKEARRILHKLFHREIGEEQIRNRACLKLLQLRSYFNMGKEASTLRPSSFEAMKYLIETGDKKLLSKKDIEALRRIAQLPEGAIRL